MTKIHNRSVETDTLHQRIAWLEAENNELRQANFTMGVMAEEAIDEACESTKEAINLRFKLYCLAVLCGCLWAITLAVGFILWS